MADSHSIRWLTACHEAGHVVAMLSFGLWPDGVTCADGHGKVFDYNFKHAWDFAMQHPEFRRQQAIISMAGPVAELEAHDEDACVWFGLIGGKSCDLDRVTEFGFTERSERINIQAAASEILEEHRAMHWRLSLLLRDLGHLHKDDLVDLWLHHRSEG